MIIMRQGHFKALARIREQVITFYKFLKSSFIQKSAILKPTKALNDKEFVYFNYFILTKSTLPVLQHFFKVLFLF